MDKKRISILFLILTPLLTFAQNSTLKANVIQPFNNSAPWITGLLLLCTLLYSVALSNNPIFLSNKFQLVMHSKDRGSFYSASVRSQTFSYSLFFGAYLISFSLFVYQALSIYTNAQPFTVMAYSFLAILLYHLVKYLIYTSVIRYLFMDKGLHPLVGQTYLFMNIVLGILLFLVNVILTYTNNEMSLNITLIAGLVFIAAYFLTLSSKLFYIFFKDVSSLFYMILYLCTLEILPLWVPIQIGIKTLIINE